MAHILNFEVIENVSTAHLLLNNLSIWDGAPVSPQYRITLPCETLERVVPLTETFQNIDKDDLNITCEDCTDLPDGVYHIVLREGAGSFIQLSKHHLRGNKFWAHYKEVLLKLEHSEFTVREDKVIKDALMDIDILLQSAKANVEIGNLDTGKAQFAKAAKSLSKIVNRVNDVCNV